MKTFVTILTSPDAKSEEYLVQALNKTAARKKVRDMYYEDVPRQAKACGFYSFNDQRLTWKNVDED